MLVMNLRISILLLTFATMLVCCTNSDKSQLSNIETIVFDFDQATESFELYPIFDTIFEAIKLETNKDCIIGEVTKMVFRHDTVFIVDNVSKSIFLFNDKGKFLSKICRAGRGRQEYLDLEDVFICDDHILVLDNYQFKVCCYDLNGNYRYSFDSKEGIEIMECDGKIFVYSTGGSVWKNHKMVELDTAGHFISYYLKAKKDEDNIDNSYNYDHIIPKRNGFDVLLPIKNIVYTYADGELRPSYKIDFGKFEMPEDVSRKDLLYFHTNNLQKKYCKGTYKIQEIGRYRFISSEFNTDIYTLIYDKVQKRTICISPDTKIGGSGTYIKNYYDNIDSYEQIGVYFNADFLCMLYRDESFETKLHGSSAILYKVAQTLSDTDNGVIIRMKLKGNDENR